MGASNGTIQGERESISIPRDIERFNASGLMDALLADRSTDTNIVWGTAAYEDLGCGFQAGDQVTVSSVSGEYAPLIKRRALKDKDERLALTKRHAEVFTPGWLCKQMNNFIEDAWLESKGAGSVSDVWQEHIKANTLEITCGEAPYLVNRYDAATGEPVELQNRCGILDRKLFQATQHAQTREEWMQWAVLALQSTYGYEFQGDNLLIARVNALCAVEDHAAHAGFKDITPDEYKQFAKIISWNLWQMDGISLCVPFGKRKEVQAQQSIFDLLVEEPLMENDGGAEDPDDTRRRDAKIFNWSSKEELSFAEIRREGTTMKFDYVIGNPPYQEESENNTRQPPIYDKFMGGGL